MAQLEKQSIHFLHTHTHKHIITVIIFWEQAQIYLIIN